MLSVLSAPKFWYLVKDEHFPKRQIFLDSSSLKEFADYNFKCDENGTNFIKWVEKKRNCSLQAISPFPTVFSKDLYSKHVKTRACLGMG